MTREPHAYAAHPYWWDAVPRPAGDAGPLPARTDVIVIGSGYTGLNAALVSARAGRATLVIDAEDVGYGCSTRNGGQVSTGIKPSYADLRARYGEAGAGAVLGEGRDALAWLGEFVASEGIACDYQVCGRFHAAHGALAFRRLVREIESRPAGLDEEVDIVPREAQRREIGSEVYHGGVVYRRHAAISPARYHAGLLERVRGAGARVVGHCAALDITGTAQAFDVSTTRGTVRARDVVVATNAYTGRLTPWLRRRVIPIGSYIIATAPLAPGLMDELLPTNRVVTDTRRVVYYYRAAPDRSRILFGGRVSARETDARRTAPALHRELARIFPSLAEIPISHAWGGFVAYTFDSLPHVGEHGGIHYATGYCGSGIALASYLGMRCGHRVLGAAAGRSALDALAFPTRPLYHGNPWFLGAAVAWYRALDRWVGHF